MGNGSVDILEIKCDPKLIVSLLNNKGIRTAYHMKSGGWISIMLDGSVDKRQIFSLLDMSYKLTDKKRYPMTIHQEWILPVNPRFYNLQKAFSKKNKIIWKQSNRIAVEDIVYRYVAAPISAILYRCEATEVDIPYHYDDGNIHMSRVMRLKKIKPYCPSFLPIERLKSYGIGSVRGPRRMPYNLIYELERKRS